MRDELKTIGFAVVVCLICSLLLAGVYSGLHGAQERNKAFDVKAKVLTALGVKIVDNGRVVMSREDIQAFFDANVDGIVLDSNGAKEYLAVDALTDDDINVRNKESGFKKHYPLYVYVDPQSRQKRYAIHVSGRGLWSVIKGYLALEEDGSTIAGLAFYEHQETPGLGGEIEKPEFQSKFVGKSFLKDGNLVRFLVLKSGQLTDDNSVDGITAATMTCLGVEELLNADYAVYNKYFESIRK